MRADLVLAPDRNADCRVLHMKKARVAVVRNEDPREAIREAFKLLGGLDSMLRGRYVAIKPNDTWADRNDITACTQADSLEAVVRYVKDCNPSRIVVSGGAGAAETGEVFALLGIDRVIREEGVEFFDHNKPPFVSVPLEHGPQPEVKVNPRVLEYEVLVSLAQLKVHYAATVTLTMKNIAMSYPAADYYGLPRSTRKHHHTFFEDLHGFIAGMCQRFPIDLGIIMGHPAMVGRGPIGGITFESQLAVAGTDFVATDCVGAQLLGIDRVRHIERAGELGLGVASLKKIELVGLQLPKARQVFLERLRGAVVRPAKTPYGHAGLKVSRGYRHAA